MLKYIISIYLCFIGVDAFSQKPPPDSSKENLTPKKEKTKAKKDTIVYKTEYGLRIGVDLSRPARAFFDKSYKGLELVGDYRITKNWYIATELGYEQEITFEDFTTSSINGSFIRLGTNYNAYKNWLDMNNEIFLGMRYGLAFFEQTLDSYTTNTSDAINPNYFNSSTVTPNSSTDLTAHWFELQLGIKTETFKNLFLSISGSYKIGLSIDEPDNFGTLYAPGFNRVFSSKTGFGFNYTISYLIPFVKK